MVCCALTYLNAALHAAAMNVRVSRTDLFIFLWSVIVLLYHNVVSHLDKPEGIKHKSSPA